MEETSIHIKSLSEQPQPSRNDDNQCYNMTEVLTISSSPNGSFISRPLTRNASQTTLLLPKHAYSHPNVRQSAYSHDHNSFDLRGSASISSSAPSSPVVEYQDSEHLDYHSTPSSSLSLDEDYCSQEEDDIQFPTYSDQSSTSMSKLPSLKLDTTSALERSSDPLPPDDLSAITSAPVISNTLQSAGDDTAVTTHPSRHVDYLSHEWAEEDIWSSWRHIVARRATLKDAQRLENAAWRTWAKSQNGLKTVSAEKLNWYAI